MVLYLSLEADLGDALRKTFVARDVLSLLCFETEVGDRPDVEAVVVKSENLVIFEVEPSPTSVDLEAAVLVTVWVAMITGTGRDNKVTATRTDAVASNQSLSGSGPQCPAVVAAVTVVSAAHRVSFLPFLAGSGWAEKYRPPAVFREMTPLRPSASDGEKSDNLTVSKYLVACLTAE